VLIGHQYALLKSLCYFQLAKGGALYTKQNRPLIRHFLMKNAVLFVVGSVITGLAVAFLLVAFFPHLLQINPAPVTVSAPRQPVVSAGVASYAAAVRASAPAVVNIYTARLVTERIARTPLEEMFGDFWPRYQQRVERSLGSGVIVDSQGHIVTNHHVIADAQSISVQLADGRTAQARVVGRDPDTDLAVLQIDLKSIPMARFGRSDALSVGDVVLAIGNPIGLSQTVTQGIVSATGRQQLGLASFEDFIQTDAAINVGNSGGALVDTQGNLIGINTAIVAKNLGVEGIGFAIPVNMVRGVLDDIVRRGRVVRGWIGIVPQDVSEPQSGVLITNLYIDSPAVRAGLRPGDIVLQIDNQPLQNAREAIASIAARRPGESLSVLVLRGRERQTIRVPVAEKPAER
jgi:serine protease DegS